MFLVHKYHDKLTFDIMPLAHYDMISDMILGQTWLYQYDPMMSFRTHTLTFVKDNQKILLRGIFNNTPTPIISTLQAARARIETKLNIPHESAMQQAQ